VGKIEKYWTKIVKTVTQYKWHLLVLCALYIFQTAFVGWIVKYVCPITSQVADNNLSVLLVTIGIVCISYIVTLRYILKERESLVSRYWILFFVAIGYLMFRRNEAFEFYGIEGWLFCYMDCAWLTVAVIEVGFLIWRLVARHRDTYHSFGVTPFLEDSPSEKDELGRGNYAQILVDKIYSTRSPGYISSGSFSILLSEHFGNGKTTFMCQLEQLAKARGIDVCWFKPWLYDDSRTLIVNYIHLLREIFGEGDKPLMKMLEKYASILASLEGYKLLSHVQSMEESLETQLKDLKEKLQEKKRPIIILVDDVDRLQSDELFRLLQLVRNVADFPYMYYIIAGDKEALGNRLRESGVSAPYEYLKKFFNLEINFPADDDHLFKIFHEELDKIVKNHHIYNDDIWNYILSLRYKKELFANIRDIKRYLNLLDYTLANYASRDMLTEVYLPNVAGICLIQCLDSEFYRILRDHNDYVLEYSDWRFRVRKDFTNVFMDRPTKDSLNKIAEQSAGKSTGRKSELQQEVEDYVNTLADFKAWSKPKDIELIGYLLDSMFASTFSGGQQIRICYPTEYFKYFATTYRNNEMSNAEIVGMFEHDEETYLQEINKVFEDGRGESFLHKMLWFSSTENYDRLEVLRKLMVAYDTEWKYEDDKSQEYKNLFFNQRYAGVIAYIFSIRKNESKEQGLKEWNRLSSWLVEKATQEHKILILSFLAEREREYVTYIYGKKENVISCVEEAAQAFITEEWAKDKCNSVNLAILSDYRGMTKNVSQYIVDVFKSQKRYETDHDLYYMVYLKNGELTWNVDFIRSVLGMPSVFAYDKTLWLDIVPEKWKAELKAFNMETPISKEDVQNSKFLQSARKYWKKKMIAGIKQAEQK